MLPYCGWLPGSSCTSHHKPTFVTVGCGSPVSDHWQAAALLKCKGSDTSRALRVGWLSGWRPCLRPQHCSSSHASQLALKAAAGRYSIGFSAKCTQGPHAELPAAACAAVLRLAYLLLPTIADRFENLPPGMQLRDSNASFWSLIFFAAWICEGWSLGFLLRLNLSDHLPLHALLAVRAVCVARKLYGMPFVTVSKQPCAAV